MLYLGKELVPLDLHVWQMCLALLLALGPVPLGLVWLRALGEAEQARSYSRNWLILGTIWCALEMVLALGLGTAGKLQLPWLLCGAGALFAVGVGWWYRTRLPGRPGVRELLLPSESPSPGEVLLLSAAGAVLVMLFLRLLIRPFADYDTLAYHLPTMAQWLQTGHLERMEQFRRLNSTYPYGWEALGSVFLFPTHEDFLAAFPNLLAWLLFGLAVYNMASQLGAAKPAALAAAVAAASLPEVVENVGGLQLTSLWPLSSWSACVAPGGTCGPTRRDT